MKYKNGHVSERTPNRLDFDSLAVRLLSRFSWLILLTGALATPLLIYWAALAVGTNSNRIADWLPANLPESVELKQFDDWFGDGHFVIVSWDGCQIDLNALPEESRSDDPRLERFAATLIERDAAENTHFIKKVVTSRSLLRTLTDEPMNLPASRAVERLTGSAIGPDGQGCAIVFLYDFPTEKLRQAIGFWTPRWIDRIAGSPDKSQGLLFRTLVTCEIPLESAHLGGPPVDNLAINEEGQRTLIRLAIAAGGLGLVLSWWSLRSIRLTVIVFLCGILSTCGATAAIWITGCHADAIVLAMPSLIYVLTISGAIHLVNYYRVAAEETGTRTAAARAMAMGMKPAALCSATTALGLLSLLASDLTPIRRFGSFSALGMGLMLIALFVLLPAALQFFGRHDGFERSSKHLDPETKAGMRSSTKSHRWKTAWVRRMIRHHRGIGLATAIGLIVLSFGLPRIQTSVDLLKLFDGKTRILADYHWLEENLGNLVPLEVLIRFDGRHLGDSSSSAQNQTLTMLDRAKVVEGVRNAIDHQFGMHGQQLISTSMSAIAFIPELPTHNKGISGVVRYRILNSKLQTGRQALIESGYLAMDLESQDELWRISLRAAAFKDVDFGLLAKDIRNVIAPMIAQANVEFNSGKDSASDRPAVSVIHTGAIPIIYKAQRELLDGLIESTLWSFLTITPLLMWVTRGLASGLVAMIPNLLPVLAVFGSMGWLGIPIDIGCMMTASIALGVAVDDTIHFLHWYRHCQTTQPDRNSAIEAAFLGCCNPTLQAAVINGLGLSVFLLSTFVPTRQFGLLMLVILSCGAVAELVLLPAILASPLGKAFDLHGGKPTSQRAVAEFQHHHQQHNNSDATETNDHTVLVHPRGDNISKPVHHCVADQTTPKDTHDLSRSLTNAHATYPTR
ncbi:efflux RND transporter permease subunit [Neorhodopirellula pilleata]|uniref:MMPL family protein n=1 Tax=Neorhodopirellula pilleata TaxID=2714738 RepID=A0A5C6ARG4_9BACT|nr:MMPL family transporter [Neorhodopirellula pilleata]TWU01819.1 MMPL family protein [Neorhodopirellula pilleata]